MVAPNGDIFLILRPVLITFTFALLLFLTVFTPHSRGAGTSETESTVPIRIGWKIVARLFEDGVGIIVPPNSPIK